MTQELQIKDLIETGKELEAHIADFIDALVNALRPVTVWMYRMGIYQQLSRFIPARIAWWIACHLPERLLLKLPVQLMAIN